MPILTIKETPPTYVEGCTVDGVAVTIVTGVGTIEVGKGNHVVLVPSQIVFQEQTCNFDHWGDGKTDNPRTVYVGDVDKSINAFYVNPSPTYTLQSNPDIDFTATIDSTQIAIIGGKGLVTVQPKTEYTVTVPIPVTYNGKIYNFSSWMDGTQTPSRTYETINWNKSGTVIYSEQPPKPPLASSLSLIIIGGLVGIIGLHWLYKRFKR